MKRFFFLFLGCTIVISGFSQIETPDKSLIQPGKWEIVPNNLKTTSGRLVIGHPAGAVWTIYIYRMSDNKYITSFSQSNSKGIFTLPAGEYRITLNNAPVENVPIKQGHDTKLKTGILGVNENNVWYLYDETQTNFYTSGNKPEKLLLPIGKYLLEAGIEKKSVFVNEKTFQDSPENLSVDAASYTMSPTGKDENAPATGRGLLWLLPKPEGFSYQLRFYFKFFTTDQADDNNPIDWCSQNSTGSTHCFDTVWLPEGNYRIHMSTAAYQGTYPVNPGYVYVFDNIPVRKGYETKLKYGYIQTSQPGIFQVFDEVGQTGYHVFLSWLSGIKIPYPVGKYRLKHYFINEIPIEITHGKVTPVNSIDSAFLNQTKWNTRMLLPKEDKLLKTGRLICDFPTGPPFYNSRSLRIPNPDRNGYTTMQLDTSLKYIDLTPGPYQFVLNGYVIDVLIEAGKEKSLKFGKLRVINGGNWSLASSTGSVYGPGLKSLAIGYYILNTNYKSILIKITESSTFEFDYADYFD